MGNKELQIKRDILEIYKILYKSNISGGLGDIFNPIMLKYLKHTVEDVEQTICSNTGSSKMNEASLSPEIAKIKTEQEVYTFYTKNLSDVCKATTSEDEVEAILKTISLGELRYLYSILTEVSLKVKITKKDIVYKLKDYFDNVERTRDLAKTITN